MNTWSLKTLDLKPRLPEILSTSDHPGAMSIREKLYARRHAAKRAE